MKDSLGNKFGSGLNFKRAVVRLLVVWVAIALIAAIFQARTTYADYRASFDDRFLVRFYLPDADPEAASSIWYVADESNMKNVPVSWTNVRNLHCFRDVIGDNWIKQYKSQEVSDPGGYVFIANPEIKFWAYDPDPSASEKTRDACIRNAEQEHVVTWVRTWWRRYYTRFLSIYVGGSAALTAIVGSVAWVLTGLRNR